MVRSGVASVADQLHAAQHLADGEEAEDLAEDDEAGDELHVGEVAQGGNGRLGEEGGGVLHVLDELLVVGLEGGERPAGLARALTEIRLRVNLRRAHLLALENELGELSSDARVVDDHGGLP